jgi:hypothetical protein
MTHRAPEPKQEASQTIHPWRATARTVIQGVAGIAAAAPILAAGTGMGNAGGAIAVGLAVSAAITRIMALPEVNALLKLVGLDADPSAEKPRGNSVV